MFFKKFSDKGWFNGAVIACIGVAFYVLLTHLNTVLGIAGRFIGYFKPIIVGAVFAYLLSPLAKFFDARLFKSDKFEKTRWVLSVFLAVVVTLLAMVVLTGMLVPQLLDSLAVFSANFDGYAKSLITFLEDTNLESVIGEENMDMLSDNLLSTVSGFVKENAGHIIGFAASSGKNIASIAISMILAIYMLMDSHRIVTGIKTLVKLVLSNRAYRTVRDFLMRCNTILLNYIVQTLLDAVIVGATNAVFMAICKMPYIGLISVVVGVTNLIPNFGPIIGCVIGAFILILVNPMYALMFVIFTLCLQTVDGYVLKPKLFSGSLGVSGLLILSSTIVLGNMFSILGILLSIPTAAVLSFLYKDYLLPWLRKRKEGTKPTIE